MIYLDNAATTPLCEAAKRAMAEAMEEYANPSSVHRAGFEVSQALAEHRKTVAKTLGCGGDEVIFTSCGTEADHLAVMGAAAALRRRGKRLVITDSEHPAVEQCAKRLEQEGMAVSRLSTKGGVLDLNEVEAIAREGDLIAASLMHANNETGAVYEVAKANEILRRHNPNALLHCDCVQSYLKLPVSFSRLKADLISVSAHKIHGPKGVGALAVKKGVRIVSQMPGGGQESGMRGGTENTVGIAGFAAAATEGFAAMEQNAKTVGQYKEFLLQELSSHPKIRFNLPQGEASPYVISMQAEGLRSEVLLRMYSAQGVCVSAGSACSAKTGKSPILKAFGLTDPQADRTIRISLSHQNTMEELAEFCRITKALVR